mgnify:CR=1 FL=1
MGTKTITAECLNCESSYDMIYMEELKKECKIPSKWLNELAYVALTHVMGKLTSSNV